MKRVFFSLCASVALLSGANVTPNDAYSVIKTPKIDLIIADSYKDKARQILSTENAILATYEKLYGYKLDDILYQGVASEHNQIANAFSTQIPFNMQMNYIGGSLIPDYFASTSWLKMIQIHESAHNFQLNAKKNPLAYYTHKYLGNLPYTSLLFVPVFPVPNLIESSFILEGNAVLNESLFGNGGRLFSGAVLATVMTQQKAGLITPQRSYNDHLFFPYGSHFYFVGGFFQLYLAQKYGIEKTDRYFLTFSNQWLPFFDNAVFKEHFGKTFEDELHGFNDWLEKTYKGFTPSRGEEVAFSKRNIALNSDKDGIYFLTTDAQSAPKLIYIDKKSQKKKVHKDNYLFGKVFKKDNQFFTSASAKVSNTDIAIALFDKNANMQKGTASKAIQRILPDGEALYFDVKSSLYAPTLYKNGQFITTVNSSVFSDTSGNIYYFKQKGKTRTLYKNKNALISYHGYYGKVVDVDKKGNVLFVSNSETGSTLYRYNGSETQRLCQGDDIVDAKLLDESHVLLEVVRAKGVAFLKTKIAPQKSHVKEVSYFFENKIVLMPKEQSLSQPAKDYSPLKNLHYSALSQSFEVNQDNEVNFNLRATFSDPLVQNSLFLYTAKYDKETRVGVGYDNSAYTLQYGADIYGVPSARDNVRDRGYGVNLYLQYPWYYHTYQNSDIGLFYHVDSDKDNKSPLSLILFFKDRKQFGHSFYPNSQNTFSIFGVHDRSDLMYGAKYDFLHDLGYAFYAGVGVQYSGSNVDTLNPKSKHGILIDHNNFSTSVDPSRVVMPSSKYDLYAKDAFKTQLSLAKVFDGSDYFFSFPLSLRREAFYGKYRYFHLKGNNSWVDFHEYTVGLTLELLALHKQAFPISFEYLKNDDLKESNNFRIVFDLSF